MPESRFVLEVRKNPNTGDFFWDVPFGLEDQFPVGSRIRYRLLGEGRCEVSRIEEDAPLGENEFEGRVMPINHGDPA